MTVVACRSDQAPLHAHVAGWLAQARGAQGVEEIRLGPLSRGEVAGQVALPAGRRGSGWSTWWMPAARETRYIPSSWSPRRRPARDTLGLPAQLAELLAARVLAVRGDAWAVLSAQAVAGRPSEEDLLCAVSGLGAEAARGGCGSWRPRGWGRSRWPRWRPRTGRWLHISRAPPGSTHRLPAPLRGNDGPAELAHRPIPTANREPRGSHRPRPRDELTAVMVGYRVDLRCTCDRAD